MSSGNSLEKFNRLTNELVVEILISLFAHQPFWDLVFTCRLLIFTVMSGTL